MPSRASKLKALATACISSTRPALERGVELTTGRDNLRHASVATNSVYLHTDEVKRARQMGKAFPASAATFEKLDHPGASVRALP